MISFCIFASGNGSNFENIVRSIEKQNLSCRVDCLIYDRKDAYVRERAEKYQVPNFYFNPQQFVEKAQFEQNISEFLTERKIDYILLCGYMRMIGPDLLKAFPERIINLHPSLLPAFKGKNAIEEAFLSKVKMTGVTIHFVDEWMDHGRIILQEEVTIEELDSLESLEKKIHETEYKLYIEVIKKIIGGNL